MAQGPYVASTPVRVVDQSCAYRNMTGIVHSRDADKHEVRLDGHGQNKTITFLTPQLRASNITDHTLTYSDQD